MSSSSLLLIILLGSAVAYFIGRSRSHQLARPVGGVRNLATLPSYYASMVGLWAFIPAMIVVLLWTAFDGSIINSLVMAALPEEAKILPREELGLVLSQVNNAASGMIGINDIGAEYQAAVRRLQSLRDISDQSMPVLTIMALMLGTLIGYRSVKASHNARYSVERLFNLALFICSSIAIVTTLGIIFSVLFESLRFFEKVPFFDFLLGTHWSPQIAIRADQIGASGSFG
ncbi:MAG: phosphate ABC transporter permease subunit PstC, partial [Gammaproteobacteria bacterium]|nr:phosphate ABC transporter permease subunit PstC [Gammaproteobacteria bacterium]